MIPGIVGRFPATELSVPHIGWNGVRSLRPELSALLPPDGESKLYFVHSYRAAVTDANQDWVSAVTDYGAPFIA